MRGFVKSVRLRRTLLTKPLKLGFYHIPPPGATKRCGRIKSPLRGFKWPVPVAYLKITVVPMAVRTITRPSSTTTREAGDAPFSAQSNPSASAASPV